MVGSTSLALQLVAAASAAGSWVAAVGVPALGAVAAAEAGVVLERLALVPRPGRAVGDGHRRPARRPRRGAGAPAPPAAPGRRPQAHRPGARAGRGARAPRPVGRRRHAPRGGVGPLARRSGRVTATCRAAAWRWWPPADGRRRANAGRSYGRKDAGRLGAGLAGRRGGSVGRAGGGRLRQPRRRLLGAGAGRGRAAGPAPAGGPGPLSRDHHRRARPGARRPRLRAGGRRGRAAHAAGRDRAARAVRVRHPRAVALLRWRRGAGRAGHAGGARSRARSAWPTAASRRALAARQRACTSWREAQTAAFLAPFPVTALERPELADLLGRLGVRTLGAFADLPSADVRRPLRSRGRAGPPAGARPRRAAAGGARARRPTWPSPRSSTRPPSVSTWPPSRRAALAAELHDELADRGLSCTRVLIEAETEHGEALARLWRHDGALTAAAIAERVRWQLDGWISSGATTAGLTLIRLVPDEVIPANGRQLGFWGGSAEADERAGRALARVQGMLGLDAVVTLAPRAAGGAARRRLLELERRSERGARGGGRGGVGARDERVRRCRARGGTVRARRLRRSSTGSRSTSSTTRTRRGGDARGRGRFPPCSSLGPRVTSYRLPARGLAREARHASTVAFPSVFGNSLRLDHLDRSGGRAAILGPIAHYNRLAPDDRRVGIEPDLVETVLDEVAAGRVVLGDRGRSRAATARSRSTWRRRTCSS